MTPEKRARGYVKALRGDPDQWPGATEGLLNHFKAIRTEALEEAAKVAEDRWRWAIFTVEGVDQKIAAAIRALKGTA